VTVACESAAGTNRREVGDEVEELSDFLIPAGDHQADGVQGGRQQRHLRARDDEA
jgi:hypothetical protein